MPNDFRCKVGGGCVGATYVCDGLPECSDGSDEEEEFCGEGTLITYFSPPISHISVLVAHF